MTRCAPQYHFWPGDSGLDAWDVHRLIELSRGLPVRAIEVASIAEFDTVHWFDGTLERPTVRKVIEHAKLIQHADLSHAIILGQDGRVMDGMHRAARALLEGHETIDAVQFEIDPEPDYRGSPTRGSPVRRQATAGALTRVTRSCSEGSHARSHL